MDQVRLHSSARLFSCLQEAKNAPYKFCRHLLRPPPAKSKPSDFAREYYAYTIIVSRIQFLYYCMPRVFAIKSTKKKERRKKHQQTAATSPSVYRDAHAKRKKNRNENDRNLNLSSRQSRPEENHIKKIREQWLQLKSNDKLTLRRHKTAATTTRNRKKTWSNSRFNW